MLLRGRAKEGGYVKQKNNLIMFDKDTERLGTHSFQDELKVYPGSAVFTYDDSFHTVDGGSRLTTHFLDSVQKPKHVKRLRIAYVPEEADRCGLWYNRWRIYLFSGGTTVIASPSFWSDGHLEGWWSRSFTALGTTNGDRLTVTRIILDGNSLAESKA